MADKQVRTELLLEDKATEALHHIGEGFEGVADKVKETAHEFLSFARDAAAVAVGVNIGSLADTFRELGEEAFGAAVGVETQVRGLAGVLAMSDKTGESLDDLRDHAADAKEALEEMSIAAGADADAVITGFGEMAERTSHTREELLGLTEEMIYASRASVGGIEALTAGMNQLELGMARAGNPIVVMIKQAGLLQGSAKQVAKELTKMAQAGHIDDVLALGEEAITRMGEKMRDVEPGFKELAASFHTMRENMFEALGEPILGALTPQLATLQKYLVDNREAINAYAKEVGEQAGQWVTEAAHLIHDGFFYLKDHAAEIRDDIEAAAHAIRSAFEFLLAHKDEIAIALGAKAALGVGGAVGSVVGAVAGRAAGAAGSFSGVGAALTASEGAGAAARVGAVGGAIANLVSPALAAQLALGGVGLALDQARKLMGEWDDGSQDLEAMRKAIADMGSDTAKWTAETTHHMDELREKALLLASSLGHGAAEVQAAYAAAQQQHGDVRAMLAPAEEAAAAVDRIGLITDNLVNVSPALQEAVNNAADGYGEAVNRAAAVHNQAALEAQAQLLVGSKNLQTAFVEAANLTDEGFASLIGVLEKTAPELAAKLKAVQGTTPETLKSAAPKMNVHFSGGQTFQIKQEFRDADPDRVALIFRQDVLNTATNRLSSAAAVPFGP